MFFIAYFIEFQDFSKTRERERERKRERDKEREREIYKNMVLTIPRHHHHDKYMC